VSGTHGSVNVHVNDESGVEGILGTVEGLPPYGVVHIGKHEGFQVSVFVGPDEALRLAQAFLTAARLMAERDVTPADPGLAPDVAEKATLIDALLNMGGAS